MFLMITNQTIYYEAWYFCDAFKLKQLMLRY